MTYADFQTMMDTLLKYFPQINARQKDQFSRLYPLYSFWNTRINVISRRDIENLYLHHVLHSLSIARIVTFKSGTLIMDAGTGGGFPGIPLAILFPEATFHLVDSIGKKVKVVELIAKETGLDNITTECNRIEDIQNQYDYIVSRAVAALPAFLGWCSHKIRRAGSHLQENGIFYLKGGDLISELNLINKPSRIFPIDSFFSESYFQGKKIIFFPI